MVQWLPRFLHLNVAYWYFDDNSRGRTVYEIQTSRLACVMKDSWKRTISIAKFEKICFVLLIIIYLTIPTIVFSMVLWVYLHVFEYNREALAQTLKKFAFKINEIGLLPETESFQSLLWGNTLEILTWNNILKLFHLNL